MGSRRLAIRLGPGQEEAIKGPHIHTYIYIYVYMCVYLHTHISIYDICIDACMYSPKVCSGSRSRPWAKDVGRT